MATCVGCSGGAACDCFIVGNDLAVVTGVGSEGDPYVVTVDCASIRACVGQVMLHLGFGSNFAAGGGDGSVLTAVGDGTSHFVF